MFPFGYLRAWATVRRCVAMQRECDGLFLTNGSPSPWSGKPIEQVLAELNAELDKYRQKPPPPEPIRWTGPEDADIREDLRALGKADHYRASYGGPGIIGFVRPKPEDV